ncbi:calpain-like protein [Aspergillus clavatus NRRL 1]|uniref:Calpain, putative n=1 Tax=Aspergillus clavatus (strain ATCC 1007 / CBS 513.65 / DSM 816 / NCTC 3887 / NRRL 1 / QM 1276 / 107) TaxID=344612 RepID=A1CTD8_ASPCL|nr:calpain, putative [Aspergillus clavatus NRRL 1]EAW06575.1 calpain, putative [Aspergillus clavatus NRRL 1]
MELTEDYNDMESTPPLSTRSEGRPPRKMQQSPQDIMSQFWNQFNTKFPGKVFTVLPDNPYARSKAARIPRGTIRGQNAGKSYEQAKRECQRTVERIVKECRRVNQKYTDPHFDVEVDLKSGRRDCLDSLGQKNMEMRPRGVKRVTEIFENPQFFVNGPTASDVRQGRDGDCWFMAALGTMGNKQGLIEKICVARDEKVGVYGFVFYRDGEWQQCIVDDKLYLRAADYDESVDERPIWDDINRKDTEEEYRRVWQTGSRALYFAQCVDPNETWLPLLEKAYAKAHGDFSSIEGGFVGEAIEDLTGGVTSDILTSNILDKDRFWNEELMKVNEEFLFGCGTGLFSNWLDPSYRGPPRDRKGISENHSYSIMDAKEIDGQRLLRMRNPWGKKEWNGAWSDGSEQWTAEWMEKLGHKFGNDGFFWISYEDLLKKYQHLDRTRLFGPEWTVTQQWTTINVPWSADYHSTRFKIDVTKAGPIVIVLSQLDTRYFKGLAGEYDFVLKFRLQKEEQEEYIVRSHSSYLINRSVNAEVDLEPGRYSVLVKVTAYRYDNIESAEEVVSRLASERREKLVQIGLSYDLAHAKGLVVETEPEKQAREEREQRRRKLERRKLREQTKLRLQKAWIRERKMELRKKRATERRSTSSSGSLSDKLNQRPTEQIIPDGPEQSPADMSNGSVNGFGAKSSQNGSVPSIHLPGQNGSKSMRQRSRDIPRSSVDTSVSSSYSVVYSEQELLEGFEFDSDLDMPSEEHMEPKTAPAASNTGAGASSDPWNAVCVVGLRVYSKDPQLSLEVARPMAEDDVEAALDMDDPAASATLEKAKCRSIPTNWS